jgi:hypothetical protein
MKKLIVLFLFLVSVGYSQTQGIPINDESGGLTFVYPHSGDIFQSGNVTQGQADIAWNFIVELQNPHDMRIDIYKLNSSGEYVQVSTLPGNWGTIHATGVGNYKLIGYAKGFNPLGEEVPTYGKVYPIYVYDTQAPLKQLNVQVAHSTTNHPKISWDIWQRGLDYQGYNIYKKITNESGWQYLNSTVATVGEYIDVTENYPVIGGVGNTHPVSYYVTAYDINGNESVPSDFVTANVSGSYEEKIKIIDNNSHSIVNNYSLKQNYPNPFNPSTIIQYQIKEPGLVKLEVYDILGNKVSELVNEVEGAGIYSVVFDASNLTSGIYICKMIVNNYSAIQKMSLLK